jgi:hypothetical protein
MTEPEPIKLSHEVPCRRCGAPVLTTDPKLTATTCDSCKREAINARELVILTGMAADRERHERLLQELIDLAWWGPRGPAEGQPADADRFDPQNAVLRLGMIVGRLETLGFRTTKVPKERVQGLPGARRRARVATATGPDATEKCIVCDEQYCDTLTRDGEPIHLACREP